jgi:hypothetical protein
MNSKKAELLALADQLDRYDKEDIDKAAAVLREYAAKLDAEPVAEPCHKCQKTGRIYMGCDIWIPCETCNSTGFIFQPPPQRGPFADLIYHAYPPAPQRKPLTFVQERAQLEQEWSDLQRMKAQYKHKPLTDEDLLGAIARGWCSPENEHKVMDPPLAFAIAAEVRRAIEAAHEIK